VEQQPQATTPDTVGGEQHAEPVAQAVVEPAPDVVPSGAPSGPRRRSRWLNLAAIGVLGLTAIGVAFALGRASTTWDIAATAADTARQPGMGAMPGHRAGPRDGGHGPMSPGGMHR
jgi:hypothetical protein